MPLTKAAKHYHRAAMRRLSSADITAQIEFNRRFITRPASGWRWWPAYVCYIGILRAELKRRTYISYIEAARQQFDADMACIEAPHIVGFTPEQLCTANIIDSWNRARPPNLPIMVTDGDAAYPEVEVAANTGSDVRGWFYVDCGGKSVASFANAVDAYEYARSLEKRIRSKD